MVTSANIPQGQSPFEQSSRSKYSGLFSFNGHVDTLANQDYIFCLFSPVKVAIQFVTVILSGGTATANFKIGTLVNNGVSITGMSAIAVTAAIQTVNFTATDGTNIAPISNVILVTITNIAAALNFDFSMAYYRDG